MIFDEIPFQLKEHIFTYVTPNEWINTGKVSQEWLKLTLGSIKKVKSCQLLILDHLAEFINQHHDTNYTSVSLLTMMPRLEHLECIENTEAFWKEISPICHQLKVLELKQGNGASFDWNNMDISFTNLVELHWDILFQGTALDLKIFEMTPILEKVKVPFVFFTSEWKHKIPKSVKHILLKDVLFVDEHHCSLNYLCEDTSALETFSVTVCMISRADFSAFLGETPRLKNLELEFEFNDEATSMVIKKAFKSCQSLETAKARGVIITDSWRRVIPQNVKSIALFKMRVQENIRLDFSLEWLFQNYGCLQSLELSCGDWIGFDPLKFYSTQNLTKLVLDNLSPQASHSDQSTSIFSDICLRMLRGSYLVDVEICKVNIDEYWRHIFPPTIKRLKLEDFRLSKGAQLVFSPQLICEIPSNIETLVLDTSHDDMPAMDLNAFTRMHLLQELHLNVSRLSGECLQSILTHCFALRHLRIRELTARSLTNIPRNLVLPSVRTLNVKEPVDQPFLLLQHFPKALTLDITIAPPEASFSAILNALQVANTVALKIRHLSWGHLRDLLESNDDPKYKYFCLFISKKSKAFIFYWTKSLLDAHNKLEHIFLDKVKVLWIKNYSSSPGLRNVARIPSSMDELSQRYDEIMANNYLNSDDDE